MSILPITEAIKISPLPNSSAGFIVFDPGKKLVYASAEALRVLIFPEKLENIGRSSRILAEMITSVVTDAQKAGSPSPPMEFLSGMRRYKFLYFVLNKVGNSSAAPEIFAVLIHRAGRISAPVSAVAEQFRLSPREKDSLELLLQGFTNKEIAQRMSISPNTVKVFLRLVMVKMGVSTRAGILGKILCAAPSERPRDLVAA